MSVQMKRVLSLIVSLVFILAIPAAPLTANAWYYEDGDFIMYSYNQVARGKILKPFTLAGSYDGKTINNIEVPLYHSSYMWNKAGNRFEPVRTSGETISGNFVQLMDITGKGKADGILIVSWKDSEAYWNSAMGWDGSFDDGGAFSGKQAWRFPYGQRLLDGYGAHGAAEDFSNIIDYGALGESSYWPTHDYYKAKSNDTLSMLTGFATTQQATGWTCGPTSALMVLDWFGLRGDLNEQDLAALRKHPRQTGATNLRQMINIFDGLSELSARGKGARGKWELVSSYDFVKKYGIKKSEKGKHNLYEVSELMDGSFFRELLDAGIPIMVGWNSFGGHWQVIIGYDDMGSEDTRDHVLILADPYDTTDHINDGYNIQSLERFVYDWSAGFDPDFDHGIFLAAVPAGWRYRKATGGGITEYNDIYDGDGTDDMKLSYGRAAADLAKYYPGTPWLGDNGLAGAATGGYERASEDYINASPYYAHFDYFNMKSGESPVSGGELIILEGFRTAQQTTEWTCGLTSALMALEWYGANPEQPRLLDAFAEGEIEAVAAKYDLDMDALGDGRLTEINLALMRGKGREKPGATTLDDMKNVFDSLNADEAYLTALAKSKGSDTILKWEYLCTDDLEDEGIQNAYGDELSLEGGLYDDGIIPYFLELGCPILVGWNEWGGHWQVVIGYDDMGTEETQDDVLILADPYDTTDHNQDGYYLESFERLVYGWVSYFDPRRENVFFIPYLVDTGAPVK